MMRSWSLVLACFESRTRVLCSRGGFSGTEPAESPAQP